MGYSDCTREQVTDMDREYHQKANEWVRCLKRAIASPGLHHQHGFDRVWQMELWHTANTKAIMFDAKGAAIYMPKYVIGWKGRHSAPLGTAHMYFASVGWKWHRYGPVAVQTSSCVLEGDIVQE